METDHIELVVPDRAKAVRWYEAWLGYQAVPEFADWVEHGPLMMSNDGRRTLLAVFDGGPTKPTNQGGWKRLALRASAAEFSEFGQRFPATGQSLQGPVDHAKSWSWYFDDPWGNAWEVTTYDYAEVAAKLRAGE